MKYSTRIHASTLLAISFIVTTLAHAQVSGEAVKGILANAEQQEGKFKVRWLPQGGLFTSERQASGVTLWRVDPITQVKTPVFSDSVTASLIKQYNTLSGTTATGLPIRSLVWERDGHGLLFTADDGATYVFNIATRVLRKLKHPEAEVPADADALMRNLEGSQLVNGTYSPDYSHIGFIRGYDLYIMNTANGEETRLTSNGTEEVMNARPDWVYPEELSQTEGFFWSPNGHKIAYLQFDERPVIQYPIVHDIKPQARLEMERYPKAGANIPIVKLFIIDLDTHKTIQVDTKSSGSIYIIRPNWTPDGSELLFQRMNRHQDTLQLLAANPNTGAVHTILTEYDSAYVNLDGGAHGFGTTPTALHFLKDGKRFLWPSERSGWCNWYLYDLSGKLLATVTHGPRVFDKILSIDEPHGVLYTAAFTDEGQEQHLFRAKLDGSAMTQITTLGGVHEVSVDPTSHYYMDVFSSPSQPSVATLHTIDGKSIRQIGALTYNLQGLTLTSPEVITVKAANGVTNLHGLLYKPVGYDSTKKYPLIVEVYGGPQVQQVQRVNAVLTQYQMEAQDGYMVWVVDNRGTPNRGRDFERATYQKLGQVDLDDQAAAVQQLTRTYHYIDSTRVGITGSSYGGYMSALALLRYPNVFQVGIATSAVTDWRNYDATYTERYMRLPQENPDGYNKGSAIVNANKLIGHLLILHGTTDNNVHVGNAMQLIQALLQAGKQFDLMLFPEERHGVNSGQIDVQFLAKYLKPMPVQ